jgi:ubiquinone/menaquinone biosynthesis C-methylase UbiE
LEVGAADWTFLLPAHESGAVLQVGSGWGGGVLELSARYSEVWSADSSGDLLRWQGIRRDAAGARNLHLIQVPPGLLPFPEGAFDLVSFPERAVRAAQSGLPSLMKTTRRVLRPGGWLHVGVRRSLRANASWIRLFQHHGFSDVRVHWAIPSSGSFVAAGRLDDSRSFVEFLRGRGWLKRNPAARLAFQAIARPMILKRVVPSLIFLARREGAQ